jgi:hypothetical protein
MKAAAVTMTQREQTEQARARALVRFNGTMFHGLAVASLLETAVPLHVGRLVHALRAIPDLRPWIEQIWWPRRAELGRQLHAYIEATWPEFDWNAACRGFQESYQPVSGVVGSRARGARELLGLCVMEAQAALFYRAIAGSADEPQLRMLANQAASDHAEFFEYFRANFERRKRIERMGFIAIFRTVTAVCRSARDHDVAAAFRALSHDWIDDTIVSGMSYADFLQRMMRILRRHAMPGPVERLLFRPWLERSSAPASELQLQAQGSWIPLAFQPVGGA